MYLKKNNETKDKTRNRETTMSIISQEPNFPKITEMTVEPSPQWMKDAGKEIQQKYNLDYIDRVYITGVIARHYRINNSKK